QANCDAFKARTLRKIRMFANFRPLFRSIAMASQLSLFLLAGILMLHGRLKAGDFLILGGAMTAVLLRLQQVSTINEQYQSAMVSSRRLCEVLMAKPTVPEKADPTPLPPGSGQVTFENVTFGYNPAKPVLHNLSFKINGGSVVAIVGPT